MRTKGEVIARARQSCDNEGGPLQTSGAGANPLACEGAPLVVGPNGRVSGKQNGGRANLHNQPLGASLRLG